MDLDPNFAVAHPEVEGLPIAQLMMQRLEAVTDDDGVFQSDDAMAPIISAIVSLERLIRQA